MKVFLALTLFFITANLSAQTMTQADVLKELPNIFKTEIGEYEGETYSYVKIDSLPASNVFSELTIDDMLYLDYIQVNYFITDRMELESMLVSLKDKPQQRNAFFTQQLSENEVFKKYFLEMSYHYLRSKGIALSNYTPQAKLRISIAQLMDIASRFFYAARIAERGVEWYICVGTNGFKEDKKESLLPLVEAFAFMTVFKNRDEQFTEDFDRATDNFSLETKSITDTKKRLETLRTKMFAEMAKNENLKTVLKREYEKKKAMLNFELVD